MVKVDINKCIGCGSCAADCNVFSIKVIEGKAVPGEVCIECGHCMAVCPQRAVTLIGDYDFSEIIEYDKNKFELTPDRLLNFIKFRRSIRQFTDESVSDEDIEKIIQAGRFTQKGANINSLRYIVLTKDTLREIMPVALKTLAELDIEKMDRKTMRTPHWYLDFNHVWKKWFAVYQATKKDLLFHNAPNALLVVGRTGNEADGCINISHMELMINALGLGACFMGFGTLAFAISEELKEKIGLKEDESVVFSLVFGHPNVKYLRTVTRKKADYQKI